MENRVIGVVAAAGLLSACAANNLVWVRPGATPAEFEQDKLRCEYEAKLATPDSYYGRGMGNAISAGIADGMRMNELGTMCMRTKGWTQQAADASPPAAAYAPPPGPPVRRNLKPSEAIAEARKPLVVKYSSSAKFTGERYVAAKSAHSEPADVVCGSMDGKPYIYFVDKEQVFIADGSPAETNRGIYRSYCERAVARR